MLALFAGSPETNRTISTLMWSVCCGCPIVVVGVICLLIFISVYVNRPREK